MTKVDYKIIFIGNTGVGKTSIFRKFQTGEFSEGNISTIGVEKKTEEMIINIDKNGKKEKINFNLIFYDTAGQEKFRAITKSYYKGSDGIILMYDITNRDSFETVGNWVESIKDSIGGGSDKYVVILIGNKLDLIGENLELIKYDREVSEEEAINICKKYDLVWGGEQSTKEIEHSKLRELFQSFVVKIYEKVGPKVNKGQKNKKIDNFKPQKKSCCQNLQ